MPEEHLLEEHLKSFVRRSRRLDERQRLLYQTGMQKFGLRPLGERLGKVLSTVLVNNQATVTPYCGVNLEIGFGDGANLLAMAKASPNELFIGAEVYEPGIFKVLSGIDEQNLSNVYLYDGDAWELLGALPESCLNCCYILFPDPWPKRRHHKRRLLQVNFLKLLHAKCATGAKLIIATDWQDYANFIAKTLSACGGWQFSCIIGDRADVASTIKAYESDVKRVVTKFESRGLASRRSIYRFECVAERSDI